MKSVFVIRDTFLIDETTGISGKLVKSQTNFANRIFKECHSLRCLSHPGVGHVSNLVPEMDTLKYVREEIKKDSLSSETFQLSPVTIHSYFIQEDSLCYFSLLT